MSEAQNNAPAAGESNNAVAVPIYGDTESARVVGKESLEKSPPDGAEKGNGSRKKHLGVDRNVLSDNSLINLATMTTEELREELQRAFEITVAQVVKIASILRLLDERGEDTSDLRGSLIPQLRKVAYGQVLPEVVVKLQAVPLVLKKVAALPIPAQREIASGEPVKVAVSGNADFRLVHADRMTVAEARQVFADDHVRDIGEQISWIRSRPSHSKSIPGAIEVDKKRKGISVSGDVFISASEMLAYLQRLT